MSHNLAVALRLAEHRLPVFPCAQTKKPLITDWENFATTDAGQIGKWWTNWPTALVGIAVGRAGLLVADCDRGHGNGADGVAQFKRLLEAHEPFRQVPPMTLTPRHGVHIVGRQPDGERLGNGRGALPNGIDVRGRGGFIIAPGSVARDGRKWVSVEGKPDLGEAYLSYTIPRWGEWFLKILQSKPERQEQHEREPDGETFHTDDQRGRRYAEQALHGIENELAATRDGERNERLYKASFRLATMAARAWLTESEIRTALHHACMANGVIRDDGIKAFSSTFDSGFNAGLKCPHPDLQDRAGHSDTGNGAEQKKAEDEPKQKRRQQRDSGASWDEPDLSWLDDARGTLPDFSTDALGSMWTGWLEQSAHGAGVSPDHVAVPMLAATASMIGTGRRIGASRSWSEPHTLWTAVVGFSGTGKTPGADVTLRALAMVESNRRAEVDAQQLAHDTRAEAAKAAKKRWEREVQEAIEAGQTPPAKPVAAQEVGKFITPRLFASNVTVERWAGLLRARPGGMFMYRDELAGHFLNMSRYTNGQDNEFWLEAFNGKHYVVERQNAPAIVIPHLLIGLSGGFQPSKLSRSFEGDDDGMYGRILFSWPPVPAYRLLTDEVGELEPELINALGRLARLSCVDADGNLASRTVPLSAEARQQFEQFRQFAHQGIEGLDGREREWWAKGSTHVLRLSGTLAFLEWSATGGPEPQEIDARHVGNAVRLWRDYFWPHACAALRVMGLSDKHREARRVLRWLKATSKREVAREEVRREALGQRLDAEGTQALLEELVRAGWLREVTTKVDGRGRPARRWEVNPRLFL